MTKYVKLQAYIDPDHMDKLIDESDKNDKPMTAIVREMFSERYSRKAKARRRKPTSDNGGARCDRRRR